MENKRIVPKRSRRTFNREVNCRGFTIVELMVALALSGFVIAMVFYSWRYISNHTIRQQQKALFQAEVDRIGQSLVLQIRKSPEVVKVASHSIVFLSQNGLDTIIYEFDGGSLLKNDTAIFCNYPGARVTRFSIEKENSGLGTDTSNFITLLLIFGMQDQSGDTSVLPFKVRAAVSPEWFNMKEGGVRGWNF